MAEAVRPRKKEKKKSSKTKSITSAIGDALATGSEDTEKNVKTESLLGEKEKEKSEDNADTLKESELKDDESLLSQKDAEAPVDEKQERSEVSDDIESCTIEEHKANVSMEEDTPLPVDSISKQESEEDENFHEAPKSLNSPIVEQIASTDTPEIGPSTGDQERTSDGGEGVAEEQDEEKAKNLDETLSPSSTSMGEESILPLDEASENVLSVQQKDDDGVEQEIEGVSKEDTAPTLDVEEGPESLGQESLEEFEELSPLSRETSVEEPSRVIATGEHSSVSTEQATAPPMDEMTTPEASAPPVESSAHTPSSLEQESDSQQQQQQHAGILDNRQQQEGMLNDEQQQQQQLKQEQQNVLDDQHPQLPLSQEWMRESVATGMRNAALVAVAPEQDPLLMDTNYFSNERRRPREDTRRAAAGEAASLDSRRAGEMEGVMEPRRPSASVRGRNPIWPTESMQPMSRQELNYYYFNNMLTNQDAMVQEFVKGSYIDKHEFYDLVNNFLRARMNVGSIQTEVKGLRDQYKENVARIWSFHLKEVPVKGTCQDDVTVKSSHTYSTVEYNEHRVKALENILSQLRTHIHGAYALVTYTAQLSRLQIECYIHHLLSRSSLFREVDDTLPVKAYLMSPHSTEGQVDVRKLRQCIAVLFAFQRKPVTDAEFVDLSRAWLQRLISMLLRVATLDDHLFIFNHLLRCPPGIGGWASTFLQVLAPVPIQDGHQDTQLLDMEGVASSSTAGQRSHVFWASPLLDHFVNMLSTVMTPVSYRDEFLAKMKAGSSNPPPGTSEGSVDWTLVDEDIDTEDEESSHMLLLNESDLVELFAQFPFTEMFSHVLLVDTHANKPYSIEQVESQDMLRLIAFSSTLIDLFHSGLETFNRSRYRQFVKRIGRLIRHTVQYVADHWTNYRTWRVEVCGDSEDTPLPSSDQQRAISLQQIQLEVDEMFFRAVQCIMSAPRLGTWQFMADMPYSCLSPHMMWRLLWFLHHSDKGEVSASAALSGRTRAKLEEYKWDLRDVSKKAMFGNKLVNMPMSEVIYLLTTFANMASARTNKETDFVEFITTEVYELAYLNKYTRDSCSKVGRELLAGIALTHPFILTNILGLIQSSMDVIGSMSIYLCSELPLYLWLPSQTDMSLLRGWLLDHAPDSTQNQLARLILSKLNWGFNEQEDELVLDINLHRKVAILVMEAFSKHIIEKQQGAFIASTLSWGISVVMGDVVNLDVWCWDLLNKLRLHKQDQPTPVLHASSMATGTLAQGHASKSAEAAAAAAGSGVGGMLDGGLSGREFAPPDLTSDPSMYPVNKGLDSKTPLACFIAVSMTKVGHSIEDFLTKGLEYLQNLVTSGCYRMCIPLIARIVPTFITSGQQDYLLSNVKFISLMETILNADNQYSRILQKLSVSFHTECTALFSSMIATLLQASKAPGSPPGSTEALYEFWLTVLTSCKMWHTNYNICQVMDATLEAALVCHKASSVLTQEIFMTHFRSSVDVKTAQKKTGGSRAPGLLSSVMSLVSAPSTLPTMQEQHKKDFPWLAYSLMAAETRFLQESGVLQVISQELHTNASITTDQAIKKANQKLKSSLLVNVNQLPIYRWAQLALDVDINHPLAPVIWQMFFSLYLERMKAEGGTVQRHSIGHRYFQCLADVAFLKKLKRQLSRTADYHHSAAQGHFPGGQRPERKSLGSAGKVTGSEVEGQGVEDSGGQDSEREDFDLQVDKEFHTRVLKLYQTYLLWLEEPLLHDASLYLPALPEQYDREKLARIFSGDMDPWMEYVDWDEVSYGVDRLVTQWLQVTRPPSYRNGVTAQRDQQIEATTQILNRLAQYDKPKPAPGVLELVAPVGDVPESLLLDHQAMLSFIQEDLNEMLDYANSFGTRESYNVALDLGYVELLPTLYHNSEVETRLEVPCKSGVVSRHRCAGPARIAIRHQESKKSDAVSRKLEENRTEYKQLSIETEAPPPPVICSAAVHIENAITDLINKTRAANDEEKDAHNQVGVALLYHLANQMNDNCRHYPPTRQFFTSCIEILGQEFVRPYPEQAQPLLHEILTNHKLAGVLAPNFMPCNCPSTFVHMYTEVVRATANNMQDLAFMMLTKDLVFMLLTKFDVSQWLERHRPTHSTCSQLINVIGEALTTCKLGEEVDSKPLPHYEVYRSHLQAMFVYNFPQHYADVMHIVFKGMEEKNLKLGILQDVLKTLDCPLLPDFGDVGQKQVEKLVQEETILSLKDLRDSLEWLGSYFSRQRNSRSDLLQFGLYSHWKEYMPTLSSLLGFLALNYVLQEAKRLQEMNSPMEQGIKALWDLIVSFFSPWVGPAEAPSASKPGSSQIVAAWSEGDVDVALVMVTLFVETTSFMQAVFHNAQQPGGQNVLSLFWEYYSCSLAKRGLREDVMYAYHRAMASLPWSEFYPDVYSMESMIKMYESKQESCLLFVASIFPRIQWLGILECLIARGDLQTTNQFLSSQLSLLIIFCNSLPIMQAQGSGIKVLVAEAHHFPWSFMDESCYHSATMWQLKKSNPRLVLEEQSASTVLSLLRSVAGVGSSEPPNPRMAAKQAAYVGLIVGLMCQCSQSREVRGEKFTTPLHGLLYDVTIISTQAGPSAANSAHLSSLLTTVLSLLNGCSPLTGAPDAIVRGLVQWLANCANSALVLQMISVACNTLASTKHMALLIESCLDSYFVTVRPLPNDPSRGWSGVVGVLQIPQLSHDEFLSQCLEGGAYLTLYAYLCQRLPQCHSLEEETALQARLVDWCINCKPSRENEFKLLLWWYKALELSTRMLSFGSPGWTVQRSLNNLAPAILAMGEDRRTSGILGALGFGKQSQLSFSFRLAARSLAVFILAQLPKDGVRMMANAPGAIVYPAPPRSPKGGGANVQQGMKLLDGALENRSYQELRPTVEYARSFILDGHHCLTDAMPFVAQLASRLFPDRPSLNVIVQRNANVSSAS